MATEARVWFCHAVASARLTAHLRRRSAPSARQAWRSRRARRSLQSILPKSKSSQGLASASAFTPNASCPASRSRCEPGRSAAPVGAPVTASSSNRTQHVHTSHACSRARTPAITSAAEQAAEVDEPPNAAPGAEAPSVKQLWPAARRLTTLRRRWRGAPLHPSRRVAASTRMRLDNLAAIPFGGPCASRNGVRQDLSFVLPRSTPVAAA